MAIDPRRAQQHATRAAFFIPGFVIATWAPLVPFAKLRTGLDEAGLGLVLLCLGLGSLLAMPLAGALAARQGCRRVMLGSTVLMLAALPLLALVPDAWLLGLVLLLFGAAVGAMDCTMNIQAVVVEREAARPMMSGFHAFYSVGSLAGALLATVVLGTGRGPLAATLAVAAIAALLCAASMRAWRRDRAPNDAPVFALPRGVVVAIGAVCFVSFLAEGAMLDWSAVFLHEVRGIAVAQAGWGFVAFNLTMTATRLVGDGVIARLGRAPTVLAGGAVGACGLALAVLAPGLGASLAGHALLGVGCANIVPVMFSLAGEQRRMPAHLAIPAVSTFGYAGVLAGPALIGFVAQGASLVFALLAVAATLAAAALLGARIGARHARM
ncbi:MFS transporter [Luteimonas kalidii]|uniref:MFS transporter n=1 Tax=Luteimonas kalidii TaxID=3042025 RepID=A0ABT6JV28_9GAMM|nr:MFS transporter [Luteimonas kalidii]MDH5834342.1 MFS transporter [Luteimonas kalidii]